MCPEKYKSTDGAVLISRARHTQDWHLEQFVISSYLYLSSMSSTDKNPTLPTREELRKLEAQEGKYRGGQVSKDSDVSAMKV